MSNELKFFGNEFDRHTGDWGVFNLNGFVFYGNDFADDGVILLNAAGKFIIGKKYKNCISIGDSSREFDTYEEAQEHYVAQIELK